MLFPESMEGVLQSGCDFRGTCSFYYFLYFCFRLFFHITRIFCLVPVASVYVFLYLGFPNSWAVSFIDLFKCSVNFYWFCSVRFEDVHRLGDGQVKHSPEVFYAGSLWKVHGLQFIIIFIYDDFCISCYE